MNLTTCTTCETPAAAHGAMTVCSSVRPECHAPSGYSVKSFSGANGARARQRDMVLAFWESQGVARWQNGGAGGGGRWLVRDVVNGGAEWLPLAGAGETDRADRAEFSHVRSAANGGAWCGCGLLPESGAVNAARGDADMTDLSPSARALLVAWPTWWAENAARPASLKRLVTRVRA